MFKTYEDYLLELEQYENGELETKPELYNTYLTHEGIEDLRVYIPPDILSEFDLVENTIKNTYLFNASKLIDDEYLFKGYKYNEDFRLKFPRINMHFDNEIVPVNVKIATLLRAIKFYQDLQINESEILVKRDKIGRTVEREYFNMSERDVINSGKDRLTSMISIYLEPYIRPIGNICRS